ncbi:hypothetical protein Emag_001644 [Eimeria magna]
MAVSPSDGFDSSSLQRSWGYPPARWHSQFWKGNPSYYPEPPATSCGSGKGLRSALKLEQLDDEFLFLRKDRVVLDLGCYPGGWSQVAVRRCLVGVEPSTAANEPSASLSRVIGVDIAQMDPLPLVHFIQGRVGDASTLRAVLQELRDQKADVVLSDMAPSCTGIRHEDHYNSMELCLYAADLMEQTLCVGGTFVVKIFMGSEVANYKTYLKSRFELVRSAKPR